MVGFSAAKQLAPKDTVLQFIGAAVGGFMINPGITNLVNAHVGTNAAGKNVVVEAAAPVANFLGVTFNTSYFGIPVALPSYAYTIFPIIVAVAIAKPLNAWLKKVLPELENGNMVIMDRFIDSSVAYQGAGRGLDQDEVAWLNNYATDGHKPDLTLLFDVDSETGLARIAANGEREVNRLDLEKIDMHQRVRQGYLDLAEAEPERIKRIDASQTLEEVVEDTWEIIKSYL